ncbi:MAG: putative glycolipid-binding domain-containing protein [Alphaproteobacteria bacterium]|nr:putative glycolipid-binding domain-containing protein [Alphaproteobacteria bacterium]
MHADARNGQSILWRRLDAPGHEACFVRWTGANWLIEGAAVGRDRGAASMLNYALVCDHNWMARKAAVSGWTPEGEIDLAIDRDTSGTWRVNGIAVPEVDGALDLDLGFTPATNTLAIRRLGLDVGESADIAAAWLDVSDWMMKPLAQGYDRLDEDHYRYRSPGNDYEARLETDPFGMVTAYPGLWVQA